MAKQRGNKNQVSLQVKETNHLNAPATAPVLALKGQVLKHNPPRHLLSPANGDIGHPVLLPSPWGPDSFLGSGGLLRALALLVARPR